MAASPKTALLLLNLGTPDAPEPGPVGRYLKEFLADPLVIDIPAPLRWLLVNVAVVPKRKYDSAEAYEKIWSDRGSPLRFHTEDLTDKVRRRLGDGWVVDFAMRYGNPDIRSRLAALAATAPERIIVAPLYPQYSLAAFQSSVDRVREVAAELRIDAPLHFAETFYEDEHFIEAFAEAGRDTGALDDADMVLFSFHGIPERHCRKTDPTGSHCFSGPSCCETIGPANSYCYRAQSYATARALAEKLGLEAGRWTVSFQSRLGRTPWIKPYTDELVADLPSRGIKRLVVFCPSFVADCLETIEEIGIRAKEDFEAAGGEKLTLVPSLNSRDSWAAAVVAMARRNAAGGSAKAQERSAA